MTHFLTRGSRIPRYFAYPKFLLTVNLSETAKLIYMILLDRAQLSVQNEGWQDDAGRVFIHYTVKSLAEAIGKSEMTVKTALKALEQQGLIFRQKQGAGLPSRIFVKVQTENCPMGGTGNFPTGGTTFDRQRDRKLSANKAKNNNYQRNYDYEEGESM